MKYEHIEICVIIGIIAGILPNLLNAFLFGSSLFTEFTFPIYILLFVIVSLMLRSKNKFYYKLKSVTAAISYIVSGIIGILGGYAKAFRLLDPEYYNEFGKPTYGSSLYLELLIMLSLVIVALSIFTAYRFTKKDEE